MMASGSGSGNFDSESTDANPRTFATSVRLRNRAPSALSSFLALGGFLAHVSIVERDQPLMLPIIASGSGSTCAFNEVDPGSPK